MKATVEMADIISICPQLPGFEQHGAEPNLAQMIYGYYNKHFDDQKSRELTVQYIDQLCEQFNNKE